MVSPITITLQFASYAAAAAALSRLDGASVNTTWPTIAHDDRPDVGTEVSAPVAPAAIVNVSNPPAPAGLPATPGFNPFQGGAAAAVVPPNAPSSAAVVAPGTAPVVPTAGLPPPPNAAAPSAPTIAQSAAAPTAPVPPASPAVVERDTQGLPWDHRIHGSTKTKNADGTWRQKRGLDPQVKLAVEAELRAAVNATVPPAAGVAPAAPLTQPAAAVSAPSTAAPAVSPSPASSVAAPSVPPAAVTAPIPPAVPSVPAPVVPAAPTSAAPVQPTITAPSPAAAPAPAAETFGAFMARLAPRMGDPTTMGHVNTALGEVGLTGLAQLPVAGPDVFKYVSERINSLMTAVPA
jgi:hypothetical protein